MWQRAVWLIVPLMVGAFIFFIQPQKTVEPEAQQNTSTLETAAQDEDFFAHNIKVVKYNREGKLYYQMQSTHITHNNKNDVAFVTQPVMTLYAAKDVQWHANAEQGKVYNRQQAIDLIDNVAVSKHEAAAQQPALRLTTQHLTLHPEDNTFSTSDAVTLTSRGMTTTATGMKANMDTNRVELLNRVRTHYEK